jgi:hypothetical protein
MEGMDNFYDSCKDNDEYLSQDSQPQNSVQHALNVELSYVLHKYTHILNSTTVLSNTTGRHIQQAK